MFGEIVIVVDIVSTKKANPIATKTTTITNSASVSYYRKRDYIAYSFISDHIIIDNCYYLLSLCKAKRYNIKWKKMNLKKFLLKIIRVFFSMA